MKRRALAILLLVFFAAAGCRRAEPRIEGTPTPGPTATPAPETYSPELSGEGPEKDAQGVFLTGEDHYRVYLSFGEIVVYEYREETFLDGIAVNAYPLTLHAEIEIVYYDDQGLRIGRGMLHNAQGGYDFPPGSSRVYAEIATDVDVRQKDFVMEYRVLPAPVSDVITGELTPIN